MAQAFAQLLAKIGAQQNTDFFQLLRLTVQALVESENIMNRSRVADRAEIE